MNPKYRFLLSGVKSNVNTEFQTGQSLNGAIATVNGFTIPIGTTGNSSYFFIRQSPFAIDSGAFPGQVITVKFPIRIDNYAQISPVYNTVMMQRYKNGTYLGNFSPDSVTFEDYTTTSYMMRTFTIEHTITDDDVNNGFYYQYFFQLSNARVVNSVVNISTSGYNITKDIAVNVTPTYKDDLAKEWELESNQRFYRPKLSGKMTFLKSDYDYINQQDFETEFVLFVLKSKDYGLTWQSYFRGKFMKTDCQFDDDHKKITVQPDTLDEYNDVLAGLEKEYDIIPLAPALVPITLDKRPLIQVYIPGDSVLSCFLGGTYWEQDANATTDTNKITGRAQDGNYNFSLSNLLKEINLTVNGTPTAATAIYSGRMSLGSGNSFSGTLSPDVPNGYHIQAAQVYSPPFWGVATYQLKRSADDVVLFQFSQVIPGKQNWDNAEFDMQAVAGSGATGSAHAEMGTYRIYTRYLLDVDKISGVNTAPIATEDITENNRNYRRVIGLIADVSYLSDNYTTEPTQWGLSNNGKYFLPPYSFYGRKYFPIARSTWRYTSIWFAFSSFDWKMEEAGRKTYTLRDSFPVSSVISTLLKQFAPGIKHEATAEYSEFLYGATVPVSGMDYMRRFTLLVSQKTNVLVGDYDQPAQKAKTTLQQFMMMLRDCFRCFWYIEDGKFKIEHIQWFRNGGSYYGSQQLTADLTLLTNIRNAKKWGYLSGEWEYEKVDLAERYQFEWMDEVTTSFEGKPIDVVSKYVTAGKIETVNVSNFTTDIDYMMLNPGEINKDGFSLFAANFKNILKFPPGVNYDEGNGYLDANGNVVYNANGAGKGWYYIKMKCQSLCQYLLLDSSRNQINGVYWHFYREDGTNIARASTTNGSVTTPDGCFILGFSFRQQTNTKPITLPVINYNSISQVEEQRYSLPYVTVSQDGVDLIMQNGILSFMVLQPSFYVYDLPARRVRINDSEVYAFGIERKKKQKIQFPSDDDPDPMKLIKTNIGNGQIDKISINLSSRMNKIALKYDTE